MVNAALFFAKVHMIFSVNSMRVNWNFVSLILLFFIMCTTISVLINSSVIKKYIADIRNEYGGRASDKIVERIKDKQLRYVKYTTLIIFFGVGGFVFVTFPFFPIHIVFLVSLAFVGGSISYSAQRAADMALIERRRLSRR